MKVIAVIFCFVWLGVSAQPDIQWQKTFGGNSFDEPSNIEQTTDGGYIVGGTSSSNNVDIFGSHGGHDYWILKLKPNGSIQWKKNLGGSNNDWAKSIHQTNDGGYIVAGYSDSNDFDVSGNHAGLYDGWVVKLDASGNIQWQRSMGGSNWDDFWSVTPCTDGGYALVGRVTSTDGDVPLNKGQIDLWVVKLHSDGTTDWIKVFGGSGNDVGYGIKQTPDGGYAVIGETASNDGDVSGLHGNVDVWVLKLGATGELEWQKTLGGDAGDIGSDILPTSDGGYIITGYVGSINSGDVSGHDQLGLLDAWVVKLDQTGTIQWQKVVGGTNPDYAEQVIAAPGGGYMVVGSTGSSDGDVTDNDGGLECWIFKIDDSGELLWQKTFGGSVADAANSICHTNDGGFAMAGYAWSTDGDVTGSPNKGKDDFWIVKLSPESTPTHETQANKLDIFPNPTTNNIYLQSIDNKLFRSIFINNLLGKEVSRQSLPGKNEVDVSNLPPGAYFIQATETDGTVYEAKFLKY